jgi:hypothetical protein
LKQAAFRGGGNSLQVLKGILPVINLRIGNTAIHSHPELLLFTDVTRDVGMMFFS